MQEMGDRKQLNHEVIMSAVTLTLCEVIKTSKEDSQKSAFHGAVPPAVSIEEYVKRIEKYSYCSDSVYVTTLIYLDRLQQRNPEFSLNKFSIHRTLITAFMIAAKFYDDFYFKNHYYAKVGGIGKNQINVLEVSFLEMVNYDLYVSPELFNIYYERLNSYIILNQ